MIRASGAAGWELISPPTGPRSSRLHPEGPGNQLLGETGSMTPVMRFLQNVFSSLLFLSDLLICPTINTDCFQNKEKNIF